MTEIPSLTLSSETTYSHDLSPEVLWYLEDRGYEIPTKKPLWRTEEPRDVPGAIFDPARVDRVIKAVEALRHTKGRWAGKPLKLEPIQVAYFVAPIFGWIKQDEEGNWVRIIRKVWIEMPRKGAKTTLAAALAFYLGFADGEAGAEVILGAASKDQAKIAYNPLKALVDGSPLLRKAGIKATKTVIEKEATQSTLKAVSSRGDLMHGANVHGGLVDELHEHKNPDLLEAIETGVGARTQPMTIIITTADAGSTTSVYAERRLMVERVCAGTVKAPGMYGVIFAMPRDGDPFDERNWDNANPLYPITPNPQAMRDAADMAKTSSVQLASFLRLHLGVRSDKAERFFDLQRWDANAGYWNESDLHGCEVYGGVDLGSVSDLTALVWLFPDNGGFDVVSRFWMPEGALEALDKRTQRMGTAWVREGWIRLTPGDTTDYNFIKHQILKDMKKFDVVQIGYDRWNATQLVNDLLDEGAPMVKVPQNVMALSPALKEMDRLIRVGSIQEEPLFRHNNNPVLRWMADNVRIREDPNGNIAPDKAESMGKIDGISAAVTGLSTFLSVEIASSQYNDGHGLELA